MDNNVFLNRIYCFIELLSFYVNKKEKFNYKLNDDQFYFFLELSRRHSLSAIFYLALKEANIEIDSNALRELEKNYYYILRKDILFEIERKEIERFLTDNKIHYLILKGPELKKYYPDQHSREYADNDILVSSGDIIIRDFFVGRGYKAEYFRESNHDVYLKEPFYNFEIHRALFNERYENQDLSKYFKDCLKKSPIKTCYEHYLNKEDFYIYFTAHTFKHYQESGCGLRTLVDYYLYTKHNDLDYSYIDSELNKIGLLDFSKQIKSLSVKVFNGEPLCGYEEQMLLRIAHSGTYGTLENSVEKGIREKGKIGFIKSRLFPHISFYKAAYPWAYRTRVLIPIAWLIHFIKRLFRNPKRAKAELKMIVEHNKQSKN